MRYYDSTIGLYRNVYGQHAGDYMLEPPDDSFICDDCEQRRPGDEWCDVHECCLHCCEDDHCTACGGDWPCDVERCNDCGATEG